jgi:hypothetical protein
MNASIIKSALVLVLVASFLHTLNLDRPKSRQALRAHRRNTTYSSSSLTTCGLNWAVTAIQSSRRGKFGESVSTERWHYVEWDEGRAGSMLLDSANDPRELKNLASDPSRAGTVREMKGLLKKLPLK